MCLDWDGRIQIDAMSEASKPLVDLYLVTEPADAMSSLPPQQLDQAAPSL
jgi:hypothetical protein